MIRYSKKYWGLHVLFRMYGSAFPRALPFSLTSAALAGFLASFFPTSTTWDLFKHPYPFQTFAFVAGFMVVFRSNLSYGRYWEGRTQLQQVTSKLTDAVVMSLQFDRTSVPAVGATQEQIDAHDWFRDTFVHLISLMHAVALATLREDFDMENLVAHDSFAQAPPFNVRRSDFDGLDDITEEAPSTGSTASGGGGGGGGKGDASSGGLRRRRASPSAGPVEPHHSSALSEHAKAHALAGKRSFLDYFILRTDVEHAQHIHSAMKLPVIGGFTQAEGVALGAFVTSGDKGAATPNLDLGIHGLILGDGTYAPAPTERVHTVLAWVQQVLIERIHAGGVKAAPPIQSRIHQVLSDSMLGYEQCKKLTETPFPFPWAQAVNIVLLIFCMTLPIIVVAFVRHPYVAAIVTFIAAHTHVMLNEVARDIEDPFHYDPNELPLPQIQYKMNERLLAVSRSRRPLAFTDVGDLTGPGNTVHMPPAAPPPAQASTAQAGTIQAGPAAATGSSSTQSIRTPTPPPPSITPASPSSATAAGASPPAATVSPPGSPPPPSPGAPTSGSITAQLSGAPSAQPPGLDAASVTAYSTANVPEEVSGAASRWRTTMQRSRSRRATIKRHSSHARITGTDDTSTASPASIPVPSPDLLPMQTTPSLGAAALSQRGTRPGAAMLYRGHRSDDVAAAAADLTAAAGGVPGGEPNPLQVIVADGRARRSGSGAAPEATKQLSLSFAGVLPEVSGSAGGRGMDAVSLAGDPKPLQAETGPSPFIGETLEAQGDKAAPSTRGEVGVEGDR